MNYRLIGLKARIGVVSLSNLSIEALVKALEKDPNLALRQWMASVKETVSLLTKIRKMIARRAWDPSFTLRAFDVFDLLVKQCLPKPTHWASGSGPVLTEWDLGGVTLRDCGSGNGEPGWGEEYSYPRWDNKALLYKQIPVQYGCWWLVGPTQYPSKEEVQEEHEKVRRFSLLAGVYRRRVVEALRLGKPVAYVPGQMGGVFLLNRWPDASQEEIDMRVPAAGAMREAFDLIDRTEAFEYLPTQDGDDDCFVALDMLAFREQVSHALRRRIAEGLTPSLLEARKSLSTHVLKAVLVRRGHYQVAGQ